MNTPTLPLKTYDALKAQMDKGGISPVHHTPYILEFLLQRERALTANIEAIEKQLNGGEKVLKE